MSNPAIASVPAPYGDGRPSPLLSVVAHKDGWAVKYGESFLGSTSLLSDALNVMATLASHDARDHGRQ